MTQANELLDSLSGEAATYVARPDAEPHIVIDEDRGVHVPHELIKIAVQYDHNVETVTFDCPRYWEGLDMSRMYIYINYMCADGKLGAYLAQNITIDEDDENIMHFTWTITKNATMVNGALSFLICIKRVDGDGNEVNHWNSELNQDLRVSKGLKGAVVTVEQYPDVITHLLTRMDKIGDGVITDEDLNSLKDKYDKALSALSKSIDEDLADVNTDIRVIKGQIADILYEPIAISSFSNNVGTVEIGRTITEVLLSWKTSKTPSSLTLDGEAIDISATSKLLENLSITHESSKKSWTLKATDERDAVATKSTSITFCNRVRYGVGASMSDIGIGELSNSKSRTFTVTAGAGEYIWYMVPKRLGTCTFKAGGFDGGFPLYSTEALTNSSGYTEDYYIYRSDNQNLGNTTVTVS